MNATDLKSLPEGTVIIDASGLAKQKHKDVWRAWFDKHGSSNTRMLNPDAVAQPLTVIYTPEAES